jgi:hypothetical protein
VPTSVSRLGVRIERTTNVSISSPTAMAKASSANVTIGTTASSANEPARVTPAVLIARVVRGSTVRIASRSGR